MKEQRKANMRQTLVAKDKLLEVIKANREKHLSAYEQSVEDYKEAVVVVCEKNLAEAKRCLKVAKTDPLGKKIGFCQEYLPPKPVSYVSSYDQAIRQLEMSIDTEILLETTEFQNYVMDEWSWKEDFVGNNATYASFKKAR